MEDSNRIAKRIEVHEESWYVLRTGLVEELTHEDGRITYRVKIWDAGRQAFITQTFNDEPISRSFVDRVKDENMSHVTRHEQEVENGKQGSTSDGDS